MIACRSADQRLLFQQLARTTGGPTRQVRESPTAGTPHRRSRSAATHLPEARLAHPVLRLYLLVLTADLRLVRISLWADHPTLYLSDQTHNLHDPDQIVSPTTVRLMVDTIADLLTTMDDLIALLILVTGQFLVVEPQREVLVPWIAVTMAEEIRESTTTAPCGRPRGTQEGPSDLLHSGSLGSPVILETLGTPETIASDLIIEDTQYRQLRSLDAHLRVRVYHRSILRINVTCRHLDTKHLIGQILRPRGHRLPICQHPLMVPRSTLSVPL